jgi:multiple sugar transport system substrate-binding protein
MKIRYKRIVPLAILALVATAMVGCASNDSADNKGGTLHVPSHLWESGPDAEYMKLLESLTLKDFPSLKVDKPIVPFADYHQQVYTQMASGKAPDVVVPYDAQLDQWIQQGLLEPLNPWLKKAGINIDDMIDAQQAAVVDGKVYGMLAFTNPGMFVYNKRLFNEAGAQVPKSAAEWRQAIEKTTNPKEGVYGTALVTGGSPVDIYQYLMPIIAGFGGAFVTDGVPTATDPKVVKALEFAKDIYDAGLTPTGLSSADMVDAFQAGKIASVTTGPFLVPASQEANPNSADDFTLTKSPFAHPTSTVNLFLAMPKGAKNKDAAASFILNVVNKKVLDFSVEKKRVPPGVPVKVSDSVLAKTPYLADVVDAAKTAVSYAPGGVGDHATDAMNIVGDAFQAMLVNGTSVRDATEAMQSQLETLLR